MNCKTGKEIEDFVNSHGLFVINISNNDINDDERLLAMINLMSEIKKQEKVCKLLSNTSLRDIELMSVLKNKGIFPSFYQYIKTSGEKLHISLEKRNDPFHIKLGNRCYIFSENHNFIDDLMIEKVHDIFMADFIIILDKLQNKDINKLDKVHNKPMLFTSAELLPSHHTKYEIIKTYDINHTDILNITKEDDKKLAYITNNKDNIIVNNCMRLDISSLC